MRCTRQTKGKLSLSLCVVPFKWSAWIWIMFRRENDVNGNTCKYFGHQPHSELLENSREDFQMRYASLHLIQCYIYVCVRFNFLNHCSFNTTNMNVLNLRKWCLIVFSYFLNKKCANLVGKWNCLHFSLTTPNCAELRWNLSYAWCELISILHEADNSQHQYYTFDN